MTTKEIYHEMKIEASKGFAYYIGYIGKRRYTAICKMVESFRDAAHEDFDLGILNFAEYQKELLKYDLMKRSLETAEY